MPSAQTLASFPFNDFPLLNLLHGGLFGNNTNGNAAEAVQVNPGDAPGFVVPPQGPAASIYCGVVCNFACLGAPISDVMLCAQADTDPAHGGEPQLAVNDDTDSFYLCPTSTQPGSQVNVYYKPAANNSGAYIFSECYSVRLHMLGLD